MMKSKLIIISGVIILLALMLAPIMVLTVWRQGSTSDWISFYGSYFGASFGALLAGLVAFVVAKMQVEAHKDQEKNRRIIQQLPTLIQLKFEVEKAKKYIVAAKDLTHNEYRINSMGISLSQVSYRNANTINKELWYEIDKIEDANFMVDFIMFRESYLKLCDILAISKEPPPHPSENNFFSKEIEIERVEKKNDPQSQNKRKLMVVQVGDAAVISEIAEGDMSEEWQKIKDGSYLDEVTKIEEKLNSLIEGIEKIKTEKN